jgi:adenosylmethionine-8-amino-7-oxononanoate aminotransferase
MKRASSGAKIGNGAFRVNPFPILIDPPHFLLYKSSKPTNKEEIDMLTERTKQFLKWDREHVIHSLFPTGGELPGLVLDKAEGFMVTDTEGKTYMDMASQLTCSNLGHRPKGIVEAIIEALKKTDFTETYYGYANPYCSECAYKLAKITPESLNRFFFSSGGGEANEFAIKFARLYWYHKGQGTKFKIISLRGSYHGSHGMSIAASGVGPLYTRGLGPLGVGFIKVPPPYCYRCPFALSHPGCDVRCAQFLSDVIENEDAETVAAFIGEPILGGGGVIDPPPEYWPMVKEICTAHNVLFIADEVQSGFCRTGKMWALEHWNTESDIMTMAKGIAGSVLPFGAVAISDKIYEGMKGQILSGGYTYSGHPISCAASSAAIDIYVKENVAENAAKVGKHMMQRLEGEFLPLPGVGEVRGKGVFLAAELVSDRESKTPIDPGVRAALTRKLLDAGIFPRGGGYMNSVLYITPPCTITMEEADRTLDIIKPIIAELDLRKPALGPRVSKGF